MLTMSGFLFYNLDLAAQLLARRAAAGGISSLSLAQQVPRSSSVREVFDSAETHEAVLRDCFDFPAIKSAGQAALQRGRSRVDYLLS